MPVVKSLMDNLVKRYGKERGERIYYAMEAEGSGPFAKGAKHHAAHVERSKKAGHGPTSAKSKARKKKR